MKKAMENKVREILWSLKDMTLEGRLAWSCSLDGQFHNVFSILTVATRLGVVRVVGDSYDSSGNIVNIGTWKVT